MRPIFICLLLFPLVARTQINRSATELSRENIKSYLENKLFKDQPYKAISFGKLQSRPSNTSHIIWSMVHYFEITETIFVDEKAIQVQKPYKFIFFMDNRMEVLRAEGAYVE